VLDGEKMSGDRWVLGLDVAGLREIRVFSQALLMLNIQAEAYLTRILLCLCCCLGCGTECYVYHDSLKYVVLDVLIKIFVSYLS